MNKIFFYLLFFLIIFSSCKNNNTDLNNYIITYLKCSVEYDDEAKINSKYILDNTDDIEIDNTDDQLSNKYIFKKDEINKVRDYAVLLNNYTIDNFKEIFNDINIINKIDDNTDDNSGNNDNYIDINIIINEYNTGEYNLIQNKPTNIKLKVIVSKKDFKNQEIMLLTKKYNCKSSIEYPFEDLRIKYIASKLTKDIIKRIKNYNL